MVSRKATYRASNGARRINVRLAYSYFDIYAAEAFSEWSHIPSPLSCVRTKNATHGDLADVIADVASMKRSTFAWSLMRCAGFLLRGTWITQRQRNSSPRPG